MGSLRRRCEDILHSPTESSFARQLFAFGEHYGFGTIAALIVTDHSPTLTEFDGISNMPSEYHDFYRAIAGAQKDPVMQFCKSSSELITWNVDTYHAHGCGRFWETQAAFGLKSGIAQAMHLPRNRHFMLGAECDRFLKPGAKNLKSTIAEFKIFIAYAQAAAFELHARTPAELSDPALNRHDLDMLRMVMNGKTVAEIADALHLTDCMVLLRQERITRKLGCSTKYQAVLKAIRLGYISC